MKTLRVKLKGSAPLLMHNGRLVDRFDPITKEMAKITAKKKKVDADYEELARLEFIGGAYCDEKMRPVLPGELIEATMAKGAAAQKLGKVFKACVFCEGDFILKYSGPGTVDKLWENENFRLMAGVRVGQSRIIRTRPMFKEWECDVEINYFEDNIQENNIMDALIEAGIKVGIGDWRPKYGRFVPVLI